MGLHMDYLKKSIEAGSLLFPSYEFLAHPIWILKSKIFQHDFGGFDEVFMPSRFYNMIKLWSRKKLGDCTFIE